MLSVIVLTRNAPRLAAQCLQSLRASADALAEDGGVEFILADDCSDPERAVMPLLREFKLQCRHPTRVIGYRRHQHYTHALGYAMSIAQPGADVLFISHDMVLTPPCVHTLRDLSGDPTIGIIRPTSQHMDYARALTITPPLPLEGIDAVTSFAEQVRREHRDAVVDVPILIGDAMLITRRVIDRIGILDPRFFGFMADIDYGIRAQRTGLRVVVARGAWLHHEGNGAGKEPAATGGRSIEDNGREMVAQTRAAYDLFRQKWDPSLPQTFRELRRHHFEHLHTLPPLPGGEFQPPLDLTADIAEIL